MYSYMCLQKVFIQYVLMMYIMHHMCRLKLSVQYNYVCAKELYNVSSYVPVEGVCTISLTEVCVDTLYIRVCRGCLYTYSQGSIMMYHYVPLHYLCTICINEVYVHPYMCCERVSE